MVITRQKLKYSKRLKKEKQHTSTENNQYTMVGSNKGKKVTVINTYIKTQDLK